MIYRQFQDLKLSALGLGTMRLPVMAKKDSAIDEEKAFEIFDLAMKNGINYYDTAWGYHGGNSEIVTGKALSRYERGSFYLATKFPGYDLKNMGKVEAIFEKQLKKCGVSYFDFYLIHNVCEMNIDAYLDESYGTMGYLLKQKENGRIKHLGCSMHGDLPVMRRFLDRYGKYMEFCQIQLNYLDYTFQKAKEKIELIKSYRLPVWVMEPLRGGKLATLPERHEKTLKALRPDERIPAWAFRFLQSLPEVVVTLSGMSTKEQLLDNLKTFETDKPLDKNEFGALMAVADDLLSAKPIPCTACHYCVSKCPKGLDIPELLALYNEHVFSKGGFLAPMAVSSLPKEKLPSACIGCRSCEAVCPQQIKVSEAMSDFVKRLAKSKT